ncbi:MAG: hypothetical protein LBS21_09995, partial [Clostridiales bacterium]|nr:hypothetical protein [Clostridiales bacterium]
WLAVITQKDIADKTIIKNICEQEEEIGMVVSELARLSEDSIVRQIYQRRQDDIMLYNKRISDYRNGMEQESLRADKESRRAEKESRRAEKESLRAEKESRRAEKESQRAEKESRRAEKAESALASQKSTISDQAKIIDELRARLAEKTES